MSIELTSQLLVLTETNYKVITKIEDFTDDSTKIL